MPYFRSRFTLLKAKSKDANPTVIIATLLKKTKNRRYFNACHISTRAFMEFLRNEKTKRRIACDIFLPVFDQNAKEPHHGSFVRFPFISDDSLKSPHNSDLDGMHNGLFYL